MSQGPGMLSLGSRWTLHSSVYLRKSDTPTQPKRVEIRRLVDYECAASKASCEQRGTIEDEQIHATELLASKLIE